MKKMLKMKKSFSWIGLILCVLVLIDVGYSFWQYYNIPLDGDIAPIILPSESCSIVLKDPLGFKAFFNHDIYVGPNRFFAHAIMYLYFNYVPNILQIFLFPIDSIYAASALFKCLVHASIIYLFGIYITGGFSLKNDRIWGVMLLVTPIFQAKGYHDEMAVIDRCITYVAFYSAPLVGVLVFFLPIHLNLWFGKPLRMPFWKLALWLLLGLSLALSGPLVAPLLLLMILSIATSMLWKYFVSNHNKHHLFWSENAVSSHFFSICILFLGVIVFSLYSLYIGGFNVESQDASVSLEGRYEKMWAGLFSIMAGGLGVPVLVLVAIMNHYLLRAMPVTHERKKILILGNWIFVLSVFYLILLPFGGYRSYRPTVIRRDTLIPITLSFSFFISFSSLYIVKNTSFAISKIYSIFLILFVFIYTNADKPIKEDNTCERNAISILQKSTSDIVKIPRRCSLLTWYPITDPNSSITPVQVLARWNVIPSTKKYYQDAQ